MCGLKTVTRPKKLSGLCQNDGKYISESMCYNIALHLDKVCVRIKHAIHIEQRGYRIT